MRRGQLLSEEARTRALPLRQHQACMMRAVRGEEYEETLRDFVFCGGMSMTTRQAAERFGVTTRTVGRWRRSIREGRIGG